MSTKPKQLSRRSFLRGAAAAGAVAATTLWLPRRPRASAMPGSIRRVIILNAPGGVRWTAHWDGAGDVLHNPWGIVNDPTARKWTSAAVTGSAGAATAPGWGLSRLLVQKPQWMDAKGWSGIYGYLASDDPTHYNLQRTAVSAPWNVAGLGAAIPNALDLAAQTAVVRVTADPDGVFNSDHASASHTLVTGQRSGQVGVVTAFQHALQQQLGGNFTSTYAMPAVSIGNAGWALGVAEYAKSRPIYLAHASQLPTVDPGKSVSAWGAALDGDWDADLLASRQAFMGQSIADYVNDQSNGDAHVKQLIQAQLHLSADNPSAQLGTLVDGTTPVTNAMLGEVFGLGSTVTPAGDPYLDVFASDQSTATPTYTAVQNDTGLQAALAVRLLQMGSPVVSLTVGGTYDSHGGEVISTTTFRTQAGNAIAIMRTLAGLQFALKRIGDPLAAGKSLWDSTVIFVCSEFGRTILNKSSTDGFNVPDGANDGGSDHGPWSAWPMLGGPVQAGGTIVADAGADPSANPQGFYQQARVFTTLLAGMGVDPSNSGYLDFSDLPPIAGGLIQGV